jgi:hypothetical protein
MSKTLFLAAAAVAGVSTIATVYYVSPIGNVASDTPSILVDAPPAEVVQKIRAISLESYLQHFGDITEREREEIALFADLTRSNLSDTETIFDLTLGSDLLMQFSVIVTPLQGSKSRVEVHAVAGDSRFSSNPSLHPYDIKLAQSVADFMATDYVSSLLKGHPPLAGQRLEHELTKRYASDEDSIRESARRMEKTFLATYGEELRDEAESYAESDSSTYDVYGAEYAEAAAEETAQAAIDAAERAGDAAAAAGAAADSMKAAAADW